MSEKIISFDDVLMCINNGNLNNDILLKALEDFESKISEYQLENFLSHLNYRTLDYEIFMKLLFKCDCINNSLLFSNLILYCNKKILKKDSLNLIFEKYKGKFELNLIGQIFIICSDEISEDTFFDKFLEKIKYILCLDLHFFIGNFDSFQIKNFGLNIAKKIILLLDFDSFFYDKFFTRRNCGNLLSNFLDKINNENSNTLEILDNSKFEISLSICKEFYYYLKLNSKRLIHFLNLGFYFAEEIFNSYNKFQYIFRLFEPNVFNDKSLRDELKSNDAKKHFDKIYSSYQTYIIYQERKKNFRNICFLILGTFLSVVATSFEIATLGFGVLTIISTAVAISITAGLAFIGGITLIATIIAIAIKYRIKKAS